MAITLIDVHTWYHAMYKISVQSDEYYAHIGHKTQNGRITTHSRALWRHSVMTLLRRDAGVASGVVSADGRNALCPG